MSTATFSFGGQIPLLYDRYLGPYIFEPFARDMSRRMHESANHVLEIAAGTGRLTRHLAERTGRHASLTATDLNPDMLEIAKQKINNSSVKWVTANAMELPFDDNSFDCVFCQFGFMFLPDKQKGFNEAYRVLKPGGQFLFSTWDKIENNSTAYIALQVVADFLKNNPPRFYHLPYSMHNTEELKQLLDSARFRNKEIHCVSLPVESESAMNIATGLVEGNPVIQEILKEDASKVEHIKTAIVERIHTEVSKDPVRSTFTAWVCEAYK